MQAPLLQDVFDLTQPMFAVYNVFDMAAHVERMRQRNPGWSDRQLRCCLYWQAGARKKLKAEALEFALKNRSLIIRYCPEAMGVNVTQTMEDAGVALEWPPLKTATQVAFVGSMLD